jgi:hypothetical protein
MLSYEVTSLPPGSANMSFCPAPTVHANREKEGHLRQLDLESPCGSARLGRPRFHGVVYDPHGSGQGHV